MNISALQAFYCGFDITTPEGNNAFSYDQRSNKKIHVPALIKGEVGDVKVGDSVVFSDDGVDARGLQKFVHIERPKQDIFIFDNHNHAFAFWGEGVRQGIIPKGSTLVHVDQHKDTRIPKKSLSSVVVGRPEAGALPPAMGRDPFSRQGAAGQDPTTEEVVYYTNHALNVGNFIPPAVNLGWFKEVVQVGSAEAFELGASPRVLDIDLDIFALIMDHIPEEVKIARLREWISQARFITIATSPFFIEQDRALHYLRRLI